MHNIKVIGISNGGSKARRATCSCGFKGVRYAYGPKDFATAQAKAEADGAKHIEEAKNSNWPSRVP